MTKKFKSSHVKKSPLSSSTTVLFLLVVLILLSLSIIKNKQQKENLTTSYQKLDAEIAELENKNQELASLLKYFSSNEFVEKEAREKLNFAEPGEAVVIIPKNNNAPVATGSNKNLVQSSPQLWWQYFFGN